MNSNSTHLQNQQEYWYVVFSGPHSWRWLYIVHVMMLDFVCVDAGCHSIITGNISLFLTANMGTLRWFSGSVTRHNHSPKWDLSYLFRMLTQSSVRKSRVLHPYCLLFDHAVCIDRSSLITLGVPMIWSLVWLLICLQIRSFAIIQWLWFAIWAIAIFRVTHIESTVWSRFNIQCR